MANILIALVIGLAGGNLLKRLKVPGGMLVGALLAVAAFHLLVLPLTLPSHTKTAAQITAGAFIGIGMERSDLKKLNSIYKQLFYVLGSLLAVNILAGLLIYWLGSFDLTTALMCCVPGGTTSVPLIAADFGANASQVFMLQFVRTLFGIGVFPAIISVVGKEHKPQEELLPVVPPQDLEPPRFSLPKWQVCLLTIACAGMAGGLGAASGIPAGALLFSMLGVMALKLLRLPAFLPRWFKTLAQVLAGAYLGCFVDVATVQSLPSLFLPAVFVVSLYLLNLWITGHILAKKFQLPLREGLLMVNPAGAPDIALIAADLNVNSPNLVVVQVIRLITAIAVFPQINMLVVYLCRLLGWA